MAISTTETQQLLRAIVHEVYQRAYTPDDDGVDVELWDDQATNNYGVWFFGWDTSGRVLRPMIHLRLCRGKVYIESNETDFDVIERLTAAGVSPECIVLGYQHPSVRSYFEFAVA